MEDTERAEKLASMKQAVALAEKAYDNMYDARSRGDAGDFYRSAKDYYDDAIHLARQLGLNEEAEKLHERLLHIKQVYRGQFTW